MPKGHYERTKRGSYYKGLEADKATKRVMYLINKQYWTLQVEAKKRNVSISELIRTIMDNYILRNNIEVIIKKPEI